MSVRPGELARITLRALAYADMAAVDNVEVLAMLNQGGASADRNPRPDAVLGEVMAMLNASRTEADRAIAPAIRRASMRYV